jgi:hypothetical protein
MRRRLTFLSAFFVLALLIGGTASAQQRFLVRMDLIDPGPLLSPQDVVGLLEGLVIPSLTSLAEMDKQGVLVGGLEAGGRNGFFIVEAESNHALSNMLANLPFWGIVRWHTTPLESFEERIGIARRHVEHLSGGE